MQVNIVPQSVADHFIQSIVPSDIFAGKQNVIFLSENAAMCGKGNAMERRTIRKGIRHMKDPFWFPKNIEIAARLGGGDPDGNPSLYDAIYKAKKASMPADNIARAVKRGAGAEDGAANYEDIVYEGYAPAGVGLIIECLTDNRNRAAAEVRSTLTKGNGSLATSGSVSFNFERKGQIVVPSEGVDFDKLFETAAEAGAEDVTDDGEVFTVVTGPSDLFTVRKALQEAGFDYDSADQVMQPKNEVELSLEDARKVSKLIDNLDDLDDVQNIYSNWTASDEVMAQLDEE